MRETRRIILTGGPSCGKTTVLNYLEKQGYPCIPETAREVLDEKRIDPKTPEFQLEIFRRQLEKEKNPSGFFDRSALDCIAYSKRNFDYVPKEIDTFEFSKRYSLVFLLEKLPLKQDGTRTEKSDEEVRRTHELIEEAYQEKGYNLISVPVFPGTLEESVERRANFILKNLENLNGI
jgi:predicted ATPase